MKVSKKQRLSLYVGLALVFGSTISAPSVLAADAQVLIPLSLLQRVVNNNFHKYQLVWV